MPQGRSTDRTITRVDELGSLATFLERVAETPEAQPGELMTAAADDPNLEIEEQVGAGGMGVVYLARDKKLDRQVAVKVHRVSGDADADRRLLAEARAMARLSHPNIVTVYEVRSVGGSLWLLMEYVPGLTLREWMATGRRDQSELIDVFEAAARGLLAAHDAGVVHRDFKPENVIVGDDGRVRVADFGLARTAELAADGSGTPAYMAPEQREGEVVDARADQYAFCVALLEGLTGEHPLAGLDTTSDETDRRECIAAATSSLSPRRLGAAVARGLSPEPANRWPDVGQLVSALRPRSSQRRRVGALVAAAAAVVIGLGVGRGAACGSGEHLESSTRPTATMLFEAAAGARPERAIPLLQQALAIRQAELGLADPRSQPIHAALATALLETAEPEQARVHLEASVELLERSGGPEPDLIEAVTVLAELDLRLYRTVESAAGYHRLLGMLDEDTVEHLEAHARHGLSLVHAGELERGREVCTKAAARFEARGISGMAHADALTCLARAEAKLGSSELSDRYAIAAFEAARTETDDTELIGDFELEAAFARARRGDRERGIAGLMRVLESGTDVQQRKARGMLSELEAGR